MFATSLALLAQEFHGKDRGTAFGVWGATTGFAVAVGPLVGGAIVEGVGWQWIFFVNVPIGAAAVVGTLTKLAESRDDREAGIDWAGVVTFSGALFCLVYALIKGNDLGWTSGEIVALLVASAILLTAFFVVERHGKHPMFDLTLFRKPTFTGASIVAFSLSASLFALFLYITLYMQNVLGYSPLETGLRFLPLSLLSFLVAPIAGRLSARLPVRGFMAGGLLLVAAALLLMHGVSAGDSWTHLLPGFIVGGIGIGLINPPLASTAIGVVPPQRSGMASGINTTFRQVGIATGIAGLGAIFQHGVTSTLRDKLPPQAGGRVHQLSEGVQSGASGLFQKAPPPIRDAARDAFITGFNHVLLVGAGVALFGAIAALVLIRQSDFVAAQPSETEATVAAGV
jgi:EmrB/QacA subfamily drug resistance transporter